MLRIFVIFLALNRKKTDYCIKLWQLDFNQRIKNHSSAPLTRPILSEVLKDYLRPNDKISALLKSGHLISLRRGLYVPGPATDLPLPASFLIANHLRGPSYVSLETALSFWGLIPERTFEVSSVTVRTSKKFTTPIGRFSYKQLSLPYYAFGIRRVEVAEHQFALLASPEKAICDKIALTAKINLRSAKQAWNFLTEDLRIDPYALKTLNTEAMSTWLEDAPKKGSLNMLIETLKAL